LKVAGGRGAYERDVLAEEVGPLSGLRGVEVKERLELLGDLLLELVVQGSILYMNTNTNVDG
jgi:hypothetical protein